jgi:hypothetical protein
MDVTTDGSGRGEPVERFKPTNGVVVGWCGIAMVVLAIGYVAAGEHSLVGLRVALGAAFAGVVIWATNLRPRVTAYPDALVLYGTVSDVTVPYLAVDDVKMGQTLNVWAGGRRYICVGIGKSLGFDTRQKMRAHGAGGLLDANRVIRLGGLTETGARHDLPTNYQAFVLQRIDDLVAAARLQHRAKEGEPPAVRTEYALPVLVALAVTGAAFVVSLLL